MLKEESCVSSNVMVLQRYYYVHLQCVCVHSDSYMMRKQMNWPGKWTRLIRIQIEGWKEQHRTSPGAIFSICLSAVVGCWMPDGCPMVDVVGGWRTHYYYIIMLLMSKVGLIIIALPVLFFLQGLFNVCFSSTNVYTISNYNNLFLANSVGCLPFDKMLLCTLNRPISI